MCLWGEDRRGKAYFSSFHIKCIYCRLDSSLSVLTLLSFAEAQISPLESPLPLSVVYSLKEFIMHSRHAQGVGEKIVRFMLHFCENRVSA